MAPKDTTPERGVWGRLRDRFGAIAKRLGIVDEEDVKKAIEHQEKRKAAREPHKKIGRILVEHGKMADGHVKKVLKEQKLARPGGKGKVAAKKKAAKKAKKTPRAAKKAKKMKKGAKKKR